MPGPGTWSAGDILTAADLNAIGTWSSYTPVVAQNGNRTATINYAEYCQINKVCFVNIDLEVTNAGTTANLITITLPVNASTGGAQRALGCGLIFDASATDVILLTALRNTASTARFLTEDSTAIDSGGTPVGLGNNPNFALASGDFISLSLMYETV